MSNDIQTIIAKCPHCSDEVLIYSHEINCGIFRHGVFIDNMQQIDPHLPEDYCKRLLEEGRIIGCGKPFMLDKSLDNNKIIYHLKICDYI